MIEKGWLLFVTVFGVSGDRGRGRGDKCSVKHRGFPLILVGQALALLFYEAFAIFFNLVFAYRFVWK